jgi:FHA domain-containing protein
MSFRTLYWLRRYLMPLHQWLTLSLVLCVTLPAFAAPEAKLLRIDPRTSLESGNPIITTIIEVAQSKRVSEAVVDCAGLANDAQLDCMSDALEKPNALYQSIPFPAKNALFMVSVDDMDRPAKYISHAKWGDSGREPGVGTAWLILVDADKRMGVSFQDARHLAGRIVAAMGPNDIVNLMFFNDRQVVRDSQWLPTSKQAQATKLIDSIKDTYASTGRNRSLLTIIKTAATDAFKALGNVGNNVKVPMHQAMVVLSTGFGGTDPSTSGPGALELQKYMTNGRFPENNTALPKTPVPVISIYFPASTYDEFRNNSLDFMQNLANPDIGGFFSVMRKGDAKHADDIVRAVRARFATMNIVKWKVSCIAPKITQSFKLVFNNVNPPIVGDTTFEEVPIGIDPTTWPLDVDRAQTTAQVGDGVYPGGRFKIYGDFCWGGDKSRAEVYFLPAGSTPPSDLKTTDLESARRAQKQLISQGMRGTAIETADAFVEFEAPDSEKIIHGAGSRGVARLVVFDNKASRTSGVTADSILELKATSAPFPVMWALGGAFAVTVLALLLVVLFRGNGKKRPQSAGTAPRAPLAPTHGGVTHAHPPTPATVHQATLQGPAGVFSVSGAAEVRAGRDGEQCVVLLTDASVSGVHATLKIEGGQFWVRDERSNNGTFVDDNRLAAGAWTRLESGARLRFGPVNFNVRLE